MSEHTPEKAQPGLTEAERDSIVCEIAGDYAFLVLGLLAHQAPDVVQFVMDRADERLTTPPGQQATS